MTRLRYMGSLGDVFHVDGAPMPAGVTVTVSDETAAHLMADYPGAFEVVEAERPAARTATKTTTGRTSTRRRTGRTPEE